MDLITPEEVIRRIELYFSGGLIQCLSPAESAAGSLGVRRSRRSKLNEPIHLGNARPALAAAIHSGTVKKAAVVKKGILICGESERDWQAGLQAAQALRGFGCQLPIQLWFLGNCPARLRGRLLKLSAVCVDATQRAQQNATAIHHSWDLKVHALLHCPFQHVLLLQAGTEVLANPEFLFDTPEYLETGATFWAAPDSCRLPPLVWTIAGLRYRPEPTFQTTQMLVDSRRCQRPLALCRWLNHHAYFFHAFTCGERGTFHLAFRKLRKSYTLLPAQKHPSEWEIHNYPSKPALFRLKTFELPND